MAQPQRIGEDAAYNQLIGMMNLEEVKRMMCPKSMGNPTKCLGCAGFKTCSAGQRAVRLMDEKKRKIEQQTAPIFIQKWTENNQGEKKTAAASETPANRPKLFANVATDQAILREACESGNAWQWIIENYEPRKNAAGEMLTKLIRECPNIAAEYGGSRRIMQRPKVVKISSAVMNQEAAVEEKPEVVETQKPEKTETEGRSQELTEFNKQQIEEAKEQCRKAIESGDPVQFLIDRGSTEENARRRVRKWTDRYPDICGDFVLPDKRRGRKKKLLEDDETIAPEQEAEPKDDEISLEDFLNEFAAEEPEEPAPEPKEKPRTGDTMLDGMRAKFDELEAEKAELMEKIRQIEAQQEAIKQCMAAFGHEL